MLGQYTVPKILTKGEFEVHSIFTVSPILRKLCTLTVRNVLPTHMNIVSKYAWKIYDTSPSFLVASRHHFLTMKISIIYHPNIVVDNNCYDHIEICLHYITYKQQYIHMMLLIITYSKSVYSITSYCR